MKRGALRQGIHKILFLMRLTLIIILIAAIQLSAKDSRSQTLTYNKKETTIRELFKEIKRQSGYNLVWSDRKLNTEEVIEVDFYKTPVKTVLDKILFGRAVTYKIAGKAIIIMEDDRSFREKGIGLFDGIDVRGRVLGENNEPLVGATVKIKGSTNSTVTNANGEFSLQNVNAKDILVISFIGYNSKEIKASENLGNIQLVLSTDKLQEVEINAGYYTVKDKERTGSISRVDSKTIAQQPVTNVLGALIGRMPGVNIEQQSGINGGGYKIEIRGVNSLRTDARQPLYLVDGVPFPASSISLAALSIAGISNLSSPLNYISPYDIESIEVLKDADATAIYGSRGSNGVVLIKTKQAKAGKTAADISFSMGLSTVGTKIKMLNTEQYLQMRTEAFANDNVTPGATSYDVNGTWDPNRYTDWQKELIGGTAQQTNLQAGISGGSDLTQFTFRANYLKQTTVSPGDFADQKGSGALNINHTSSDKKFKGNFSTTYAIDYNTLPTFDLTQFIDAAPNAPALYDGNGNLNWAYNSSGVSTWTNPLFGNNIPYLGKTGTFLGNGRLSYELLPGLSIISTLGFTNLQLKETKKTTLNSQLPSPSNSGNRSLVHTNIETWIIEPQINYLKSFKNAKLDILLGSTFQGNSQVTERLTGTGYTSDLLLENFGSAPTRSITNTSAQYRYNSLFGRINYNYQGKYIVNITGRRDGSSKFGPDRKFANFGAIGLAWIFSQENFIKNNLQWLSYGKLRSSYGITGSDQIPDYGYQQTYTSTPLAYGDGPALVPSRISNPDFSWETNKKLELALELGLLNDRVQFTTSWYRNRSSNQLVGYTLPDIAGFTSVQYNLPAIVQNTGWEFEVSSNNISGNKFNWQTSFNISIPRNKLVSYPNISGSTYTNTYTVGYSLYTAIAYQYLGVDPQTGIHKFADLDGNGTLNAADRLPASQSLSTHWYSGIQNSFSFKGIELSIFFQYVDKTLKNPLQLFNSPGTISGGLNANQPVEVLARWRAVGDQTSIQKFSQSFATASPYTQFSNLMSSNDYIDASFLRLKNVSLSYLLPKSLSKHAGLRSCRVFLQGQNLFTVTNYLGDPEIGMIKTLPTLRTFTTGLTIGL